MKPLQSLLLPPTLNLSRELLGCDLRFLPLGQVSMLLQFPFGHIREEFAEVNPLEIGESLERDSVILRNGGSDACFLGHVQAHNHESSGFVETILWPQSSLLATQKSQKNHILVVTRPRKGHNGAMQRPARQTPQPSKSKDAYKSKRHKFYADEWVAAGLDELGKANKEAGRPYTNRSEILTALARKEIRKNAAAIRKALEARGISLPESIFKKD